MNRLKDLAARADPGFFDALVRETDAARSCEEVLRLSTLRQKAARRGLLAAHPPVRIAVVGGYTLYPLHELISHLLAASGSDDWRSAELWLGDFDNYAAEIIDNAALSAFAPDVILFLPSHRRCRYSGGLGDALDQQRREATDVATHVLDLCRVAHERTGAEVILANFPLPARFDPGAYRVRTLGSDWSFRKLVNLELGLRAPGAVTVCDVEFLSARLGTLVAFDPHAWFDSKQPYGRELLLEVAREVVHLIRALRRSAKKVAVVDLDNTLWGGVIGDDGLDGIEIGDTSPRGEAFKAFQHFLLSLTARGVLLAACSKNDYAAAAEPFEKHPDMVLRLNDFACFRANWQPKSENLREIATALNVGLDSLVFMDDNPAEIEIVRQFVPDVECVLLGDDPAAFVGIVQDARCFEPRAVTAEDGQRVALYREDAARQAHQAAVTDMDLYLTSLDMEARFSAFQPVDVPRISQLINKSNQFNLTTRRRTEAEVQGVMEDPAYCAFTMRLADKFGDNGLISVVIMRVENDAADIDTWLMSCRVLKRQVEEAVLNEIVRLAASRGAARVYGTYLPTTKNGMVRDHYPGLGFLPIDDTDGACRFELDVRTYQQRPTHIRVTTRSYDA